MGVEVIVVETTQMESCELLHDFKSKSHADARLVDESTCWGEQATVECILDVFQNEVGGLYKAETAIFSAGKNIGDLDANALQECTICDLEVSSGKAEAFKEVFA